MTDYTMRIDGENLSDSQDAAIKKALDALQDFLFAPNESATEKNNALQRACGEARKSVLNIQSKVKKAEEKK